MKFHAILMTRDAIDVIDQSLAYASSWADFVYVYDTGSTDGTWETVLQFADRDNRVVPFRHEAIVFWEGIRSVVFNHFRNRARDGDWFVKVDEDEFYHIPPPEFVRHYLRPHETCVYGQTYEFRLTVEEAARYRHQRNINADRKRPIDERRRYYQPLEYSEHRLFRYRESMVWTPDNSFPYNAGYVARRRIPIRHYPHRDPEQLAQRLRLRRMLLRFLPTGSYPHWHAGTWRDFLIDSADPSLKYWQPGESLPLIDLHSHLAPALKRAAQRIAHGALLPILDRLRKPFPPDFQPVKLTSDV